MPQKKHKPEEIVAKLRQVGTLVSQGQALAKDRIAGNDGSQAIPLRIICQDR